MIKFQNTFKKGTINRDSDPRFVAPDEMLDAENFFVATVDSNMGVGKNALGNALKTAYAITGGKNVGTGVDSTNGFIYNFIKGTLYDYIIEYNVDTTLSEIVLQSTTGTRLNFIDGERVLNVDVIFSDKPYDPVTQKDGNLLKFSGDSNPPRILNINRAKTWGLDGFAADEIMLIKPPPVYSPAITQLNTLEDVENYLEDKFISFSYRYKYKDGYYSAISSWQEYAFTPGKFLLDFGTFENKGMLNIFNACNIHFNTGPREVEAIDLLFKESNSTTPYKIDQYVKEDESWPDNTTQTIQFSNSKVYTPLPLDQYFRSFDNVPESEVAATIAGNRVMSGNYKENKDLIDKNGNKVVPDYTLNLITNSFVSNNVTVTPLNSVSPFDSSVITNGKVQLNFSTSDFIAGSIIYITLNIKGTYIIGEDITEDLFNNTYNFILDKDYANIQDLVEDTSNGFKDNLENYFSDFLKGTSLQIPDDTIIPFIYNGFKLNVINANVIEIVFPTVRYEIEKVDPDPNVFVNEYFRNVVTVSSIESLGSKKSLKSYRSYEICMIYKDKYGRKTTALTSTNNTIFIPIKNSITQNIISVNIPSTQKPPVWANTYKFGIKENRGPYEEIYASIFYKDGIYRWIRLDGVNRNKVSEGDLLLVKKDVYNPIANVTKTKVIEIKTQEADFIVGNKDNDGNLITEQAGVYMKIRPEGFSIDYGEDEFRYSEDNTATQNDRPFSYLGGNIFSAPSGDPVIYTDVPIVQGSELTINLHSDYHRDSERNDYNRTFIVNDNYANFKDYYDAELAGIVFQGTSGGIFGKEMVKGRFVYLFGSRQFVADPAGQYYLRIEGTAAGNGTTRRGFLDANLLLRSISGYFVFETLGKETPNDIFYETPDIFTVTDGEHQFTNHLLAKTFNCYVQGNGAESHQIRDGFNEKYVSIDFSPTAVSEDEYKQINRFADITYSGVYNSNTNVNKLNEFNLYLANFKDDIDKSYGPIYKIKGLDTNLQVLQEDKDSIIYYGKDILFNADGTSNLSKIEDVLGIQDTYQGEYGISMNPESFDIYASTIYHSDVKRGVVMKKTNNGLFEISSQKMTNYFKKLFRDNVINQVIGRYDQYHDVYILNVKFNTTEYVTWVYSDLDDGWLGRLTFNPEDMCRVNSKFFSFKNGEIYEHNQPNGRNTFYGEEFLSKFVFNFSQNPSERKIYKNLEIEGTDPWQIELKTDLESGFINSNDFQKQEGVFRAYPRTSNAIIDNASLTVQGIGNCTIDGLILNFSFSLEGEVSVGDTIVNLSNQVVGIIQNKTENSLTLTSVANIVSGDYVMCSKSKSAESQGLLGYHMLVTASISKNTKTEVYAFNSNVIKSYT